MSESYVTQGVIHSIGQTTEYGQNGFTKREFVIKLSGEGENAEYPNYVALELTKDKCALMDGFMTGQEIKVRFNLGGRLWDGNGSGERCFVSLQAWKIAPVEGRQIQEPQQSYQPAPPPPQPADDFDDQTIPF
jgi:hypothetical protein